MGQNFAAGKQARLGEARRKIGRFCVVFGICLWGAMALIAQPLSAQFSESETIRAVATEYLWIIGIGFGGYGMVMSSCAAFNGIGHPMPGLVVSLLRALVVLMPLAFVGKAVFGLNGIFIAAAASNLLTGVLGYVWLGRLLDILGEKIARRRPIST
jgi:Na+-driven multidrug efflux pump